MMLQWASLVLAALTFGTIASGHVVVRRINYRHGTKPSPRRTRTARWSRDESNP